MEEMEQVMDEVPARSDYEKPTVAELGSVVELTQGSGSADTADMKRYYY